jgi:hypothetical protein
MQERRQISMILLVLTAICLLVVVSASARVTATYFEVLANCDGRGGWLVINEECDGSVTVHVLCDGGSGGPVSP